MRLYGGKTVRNIINSKISKHTELRNGVIFNIYSTDQYVDVKIQGSDKLIKAYYPFNHYEQPDYIKKGNAVLISHPTGNQGRIEIVGPGLLLPSVAPGSTGTVTVSSGVPTDNIVSGCEIQQKPNDPGMAVMVRTGVLMFDGATYTLDAVSMANSSNWSVGDGGKLGEIAAVIPIDSANSTNFRIDKIQVSSDLDVDYTIGTTFTTGTSASTYIPDTSGQHISLNTILIPPNLTCVTQPYIGMGYTEPTIVNAETSNEQTTGIGVQFYTTIYIRVLDQYTNVIKSTGYFQVDAEITNGGGSLKYGSLTGTTITFAMSGGTTKMQYMFMTTDMVLASTYAEITFNIHAEWQTFTKYEIIFNSSST